MPRKPTPGAMFVAFAEYLTSLGLAPRTVQLYATAVQATHTKIGADKITVRHLDEHYAICTMSYRATWAQAWKHWVEFRRADGIVVPAPVVVPKAVAAPVVSVPTASRHGSVGTGAQRRRCRSQAACPTDWGPTGRLLLDGRLRAGNATVRQLGQAGARAQPHGTDHGPVSKRAPGVCG